MKNNKVLTNGNFIEDQRYRQLRETWDKIEKFFRKDYPAILLGAVITAAIAFSILSYKQNKGKESFSVSRSNVLGEKSGSVSAMATVSAQSAKSEEGVLISSMSGREAGSKSTPTSSKTDYPVNINTADLATLDLLPGIGPVIAKKIIDYRTTHGFFRKASDLLNVSGIGEKKLQRLKGLVTVAGGE